MDELFTLNDLYDTATPPSQGRGAEPGLARARFWIKLVPEQVVRKPDSPVKNRIPGNVARPENWQVINSICGNAWGAKQGDAWQLFSSKTTNNVWLE